MVNGQWSIGAEFSAPDESRSSALVLEPCNSSFNIHNSTFAAGGTALPLTPYALRSHRGFTILEIIIVLFLFVGLLGIVLPRISLEENLGSVGRQMVRTVRSLQDLSMVTQKPLRLYVDIDRGVYWLMILDGDQEKVPIEHPTWATPLHLPTPFRISDMVVGQTIKSSGRVDLSFYPSGRIDPMTMHLVDTRNNLLAIAIEPVTGAIRMSDERIDPPPPTPLLILDRVKPLLRMTEIVKDSRQP